MRVTARLSCFDVGPREWRQARDGREARLGLVRKAWQLRVLERAWT